MYREERLRSTEYLARITQLVSGSPGIAKDEILYL